MHQTVSYLHWVTLICCILAWCSRFKSRPSPRSRSRSCRISPLRKFPAKLRTTKKPRSRTDSTKSYNSRKTVPLARLCSGNVEIDIVNSDNPLPFTMAFTALEWLVRRYTDYISLRPIYIFLPMTNKWRKSKAPDDRSPASSRDVTFWMRRNDSIACCRSGYEG